MTNKNKLVICMLVTLNKMESNLKLQIEKNYPKMSTLNSYDTLII